MTEPKKRNSTSLMLLLLYALLIASLLVLTLAGARLYSDTMDARDAHAKQRSALSYIQSQTAACGGKGNIRLIDGPEGPAVCLREPESELQKRASIYMKTRCARSFHGSRRRSTPITPKSCATLKRLKPSFRKTGLFNDHCGRHDRRRVL